MHTLTLSRRLRLAARTLAAVAGVALSLACLTASAAAPPPPNDDLAAATILAPGGGTLTTDNTGATKEPGEPDHAGDVGGHSIWFRWTPNFSGAVSIDTDGSALDTLLAAYTGSSVGSLSLVASSDDVDESQSFSRVCFTALASTTYTIAVEGYAGETGAVKLAYGPKTDSAPCPTLPPTITGPAQPKVGDTLSLVGGSFRYAGADRSVTWERCVEQLCITIDGATGSSYVVQDRDVGTAIRAQERVTTADGTAQNESAPSAAASMPTATHANGRIFWVTKLPSTPSTFRIDSMFSDGSGLQPLTTATASPSFSTEPSVSPDGRQVAFVHFGNGSHIELMNADGSGVEDLGVDGFYPTWSPDGSRLAFSSSEGIESIDEQATTSCYCRSRPARARDRSTGLRTAARSRSPIASRAIQISTSRSSPPTDVARSRSSRPHRSTITTPPGRRPATGSRSTAARSRGRSPTAIST
jgi:hypothetical protein